MKEGIIITVIGGIILMVIGYFVKKKEKPFSDNEKELLQNFIKELNEVFIYISGNNIDAAINFNDVGKEDYLASIKEILDIPIKFNTSFPTKQIKDLVESPFFPIDIKREFFFLLSPPYSNITTQYEGVIIRVLRKDDFPILLKLLAQKVKPHIIVGAPMLTIYYSNPYFTTIKDFYKGLRDLKEYLEVKYKVNF